MTKPNDYYTIILKDETIKKVGIYNELISQLKQENVDILKNIEKERSNYQKKLQKLKQDSRDTIKTLQSAIKDLTRDIIKNNKTLNKHSVEEIPFTVQRD